MMTTSFLKTKLTYLSTGFNKFYSGVESDTFENGDDIVLKDKTDVFEHWLQ